MTILAYTTTHLVEYERTGSLLTIARHSDGKCKGLTGKGIAGNFKDSLNGVNAQRVTNLFLRMAENQEWKPLYKAGGTHKVASLYDVTKKD